MADNQEELFVVPDDMFAFVSSKSRYVAVVHKSYVYIAKLIQAQLAIDPTLDYIELDCNEPALKALVRYFEIHAGSTTGLAPEMPLRSRSMVDVCDNRLDAELINSLAAEHTLNDLYELINLALHLQIKNLLHLGCAKIASLIKGQALDQIKQILDPARSVQREARDEITSFPYNQSQSSQNQTQQQAQAQAQMMNQPQVPADKN